MCEAGGEREHWWSKHWVGSELQELFLAGLFLICQQVVKEGICSCCRLQSQHCAGSPGFGVGVAKAAGDLEFQCRLKQHMRL